MTPELEALLRSGRPLAVDDVIEAGGTAEDLLALDEPLTENEADPFADARPRADAGGEHTAPKNEYEGDKAIIRHECMSDSIDALLRELRRDDTVFQRDGKLVHVVRIAESEIELLNGKPVIRAAAGAPRIIELEPATVREKLARLVDFKVYRAPKRKGDVGTWVSADIPKDYVQIITARAQWPGIRPLSSIIETPIMRADGSIVDVPGYDELSGVVYIPRRDFPKIPERPTQEDARAALAALSVPWTDFPVASPAGHAVPVAALLSIICRPAILGAVPAFFFDASTAGSGKTLQAKCVSTLAHGREASVSTWPSGNNEEAEKNLGAIGLDGSTIALFDNVAGAFDGAPLDKVLTCSDKVGLRVLGKTKRVEVKWRAVVLATGNNATIGSDTSRRTVIQRLVPPMENPETRDRSIYKIPELEKWCMGNHPRFVCEALTLVRAYILAGKPDQGIGTMGSFEAWSELIAGAIRWAGGPNILEAVVKTAMGDNSDDADKRNLVNGWPVVTKTGVTAKEMIATLYPKDQLEGRAPLDGYDLVRDAITSLTETKPGRQPESKKLGFVLRSIKGRIFGGRSMESKDNGHGTQVWYVKGNADG